MFKEFEPNNYLMYQEYLDISDDERLEYEKSCHEFFMSPRIQHIGLIGAI